MTHSGNASAAKGQFEDEAVCFVGCEFPEFPLSCEFLQPNMMELLQQKPTDCWLLIHIITVVKPSYLSQKGAL